MHLLFVFSKEEQDLLASQSLIWKSGLIHLLMNSLL